MKHKESLFQSFILSCKKEVSLCQKKKKSRLFFSIGHKNTYSFIITLSCLFNELLKLRRETVVRIPSIWVRVRFANTSRRNDGRNKYIKRIKDKEEEDLTELDCESSNQDGKKEKEGAMRGKMQLRRQHERNFSF